MGCHVIYCKIFSSFTVHIFDDALFESSPLGEAV